MAYLACISLLLLAGYSFAATPTCKKINDCACTPTDAPTAGIVNFYPLVNSADKKAIYMVNGTSLISKDNYTFYFNPCVGFDMTSTTTDKCANDLVCQKGIKTNWTYALGAYNSTKFAYVNTTLYAYYYSKTTNNRTSEVQLICDENESAGKFEFVAEPRVLYYQFKYTSMCACPGKCPNKTLANSKWIQVDSCSYVDTRSGEVLSLRELETPLKAAVDSNVAYYYDPCGGAEMKAIDDQCANAALCQQDSSKSSPTYQAISRKDPTISEDAGEIVLRYPAAVAGRQGIDVSLVCDELATKSVLSNGGKNRLVLKSKHACPRELQ